MTTKQAAKISATLIAVKGDATPSTHLVDDKDRQVKLSIRIDHVRHKQLRLYGIETGKSNQDILAEALDMYLLNKGMK